VCPTGYGSYGQSLVTDIGQLIETVAFAFSIMGVIASVSSTYSFPLAAGNDSLAEGHWVAYNQFLSFIRRSCRDGLGLAHPLSVCSVRRGVSRRVDFFHAVRVLRVSLNRYLDD
jgi:hypothetical protein